MAEPREWQGEHNHHFHWRALGFLTDFSRLNRRMHNKSFTADNQATIIGGRNVGDEYFGATDGVLFVDLDALVIGPIVNEVSKDFDRYWASASSYPVDLLLPRVDPAVLPEIASAALRIEHDPAAQAYVRALRNSSFGSELVQGTLPFEWAATRMVSDDPAKGLGLAAPEALVSGKLREIIGESASDVELVSAYFVPTAAGTDALVSLARRGVRGQSNRATHAAHAPEADRVRASVPQPRRWRPRRQRQRRRAQDADHPHRGLAALVVAFDAQRLLEVELAVQRMRRRIRLAYLDVHR